MDDPVVTPDRWSGFAADEILVIAGGLIVAAGVAVASGDVERAKAISPLTDEARAAMDRVLAREIAETAQHQYGVTFPIAAKAVVKGPNAHPFYRWAAEARPKDVPRWNFHKYLIGRDGYIADAFPESVTPDDTRIKTGIARALAAA